MIGGYVLDASTQAMIDSLERPEERERLTHFLTVDLQDGKGTGIIYDVFLSLKANRIFMEKLPSQVNREMIKPWTESSLRLEAVLSSVLKSYQEGRAAMERSASQAENAAQRMEKIESQFGIAMQKAAEGIDTQPLSQKINETVLKSTVEPLTRLAEKLANILDILQEVLLHAETTIKMFRRLSLPGIAGVAFTAALLLCGSISIIVVGRIHEAYDRQLAAAVETNGAAFGQLSRLHAKVELVPQGDSQGNPIPGCWALSVDGAEQAQMNSNDPRRRGVIFFRQADFNL